MSTTTLTKKKTAPAKVGIVLTEEEYISLNNMLTSKDPEDHTMAQAVFVQCDVQKSIYWIWKLAGSHASKMVYLRTKLGRLFEKEAQLFHIAWKKPTDFALHLEKTQWLTPEIYQYLKKDIVKELADRNKHGNFYNVHITIKEEYKQYDPDHQLTLIQ